MLTEGAKPTDVFATHLRELTNTELHDLSQLARKAKWREVTGRAYDTADVEFWEPCARAFFIRIPPGGSIPRHHDDFIPHVTHHLVLQTNEGCENWWIDTNGVERSIHMEWAHRYQVAREPLHWAFNKGETSRIHLLVEFE